jgi:hypothetical protein
VKLIESVKEGAFDKVELMLQVPLPARMVAVVELWVVGLWVALRVVDMVGVLATAAIMVVAKMHICKCVSGKVVEDA